MTDGGERVAPARELARRVTARLVAEGVVAAEQRDALAERIAQGAMTQRDWEALVDGTLDLARRGR
ncbi:hypothetical protein J421_0256 [Gemmatirosa kalamazoonensis]|uniref:Uncharacterized protein n=1 Tax=Gemmatirosa kalamazoonensis TaxID=861299 RepID=W0REJ0_9BACT|nr:hypothetical protein [Gemmatirosa kalamazoonensis]AHG87793.1 hypothetical protein J421_0256 [Gemmatirosa kalamazoonensis]